MDPNLYNTSRGGLSLHELLEIMEEDSENQYENMDIYIQPPEDNLEDTDGDSDGSDDEHAGDANRLCRGILQQKVEIRVREDDDYEEDDLIPLANLFPKNKPNTALEKKISK